MDLIEITFKDSGITFVRLGGTLTRTQRNSAMGHFENSPEMWIIPILIMANFVVGFGSGPGSLS